MIKHLTEALDKSQSDYCDIRWERRQLTKINCAHRDVNFIGSSILGGGNIRSLHNGGFASAVLTDPANIEDFMEWTNRSARAAANKQQTPVRFAPASSHQDQVRIAPSIDPRSMPLAEKKALVDHYNDIILSTPGVQTSRISYHENAIRKYFVSSEGAKIDQENLIVMLSCVIVAKGSEGVQTVSIGFGGGTDYQRLLNRDVELRAKIAVAVDLLKAPPVKAGSYTAVLNGEMTGVFAHEAFGHFSEADIVLRNRELKDQMCLGRKMGHPMLNISDDAALKECPGSFCYDDDGVPAQKTALIKEGVLVGRLHSRETAALFGESLSGNSRAADHSYTPAVRMSNIFIEPGQDTPEALIGAVKKGIYLLDVKGGQTVGDQFSFGAQYGYLIENGKIGRLVRDINVSGNLFSTMQNISGIANDLTISERGGCGKGTGEGIQLLDKSGIGGPHIRIEKVTIGGAA